jgi:V8-like Glu-specific endopeptidase
MDVITRVVREVIAKLEFEDKVSRPGAERSMSDSFMPNFPSAGQSRAGRMKRADALKDIPFIASVDPTAQPFSNVSAAAAIDNPVRMLEGWTRPEAAVGRYLTSPAGLLQLLAERRRAVAIVSAEGVDHEGQIGSWSGTAFIVSRNLLLTNHHVLNSPEVAKAAVAEFNYEISPDNIQAGAARLPQATQSFAIDPDRLFLTSPIKDGLDYTFVWIDDAAHEAFGCIPMERSSFTIAKGEQAFIVHHPNGEPKQISLDDTDVVNITETVIHYSSDTMGGSSGAPVFDRRGRLIALHHASRRQSVDLPDGGRIDDINEGIKIAAIAVDLENRVRAGGPDAEFAHTILKEIKGSDTLAGFFSGNGRRISSGSTATEAVVDIYRGTDQDIDVGFWNIEWLAREWDTNPAKLDGAAKVIVDLNLDAWGLSEVSPLAVEALVARIEKIYGEHYDYDLSEPDATDGKQSTAMIWKVSTLDGRKEDWPSSIEPLFRKRSDDPLVMSESVHGKIFDRYPGLFHFTTKDRTPAYSFFAVPLHLKAMAEGGLRRRLASRIMARAVKELAGTKPEDVILGGDMNAPLASGDFAAIEEAGFEVLGAQDEREGAFSYIKTPKSAIDNIFLSPNMRQTVGKADYFIVARDRQMPNYTDISDHRPIAVRLSLGQTVVEKRSFDTAELDKTIEAMLGKPDSANSEENAPLKRPHRGGRSSGGGKIDYDDFKAMIMNPEIPDSTIAQYLTVDTENRKSGPFDPRLVPDPAKVAMTPDGNFDVESAIRWGNSICRWRRQAKFKSQVGRSGDKRPILVSEGDSWFQFPFLIDDVIDHLEPEYLIWSLDAAGDTADNMVNRKPEYMTEGLRRQKANNIAGFLFSAAGNDVIGEDLTGKPVLGTMIKPFRSGSDAASHIDTAQLSTVLNRLEMDYRTVIGTIRAEQGFERLPIFIHGYDYAIPGGFDGDARNPIYAKQDEWLGGPLIEKGIKDVTLQREIIRRLVDSLYDMMFKVAGKPSETGVHVIDVRGTLKIENNEWADEIHGTSAGFKKVAKLFSKAIANAI